MPCYTIQTNEIDFQQVDLQTFLDALKASGHMIFDVGHNYVTFRMKGSSTTMEFQNGKLESELNEADLQKSSLQLKREYAKQVVRATAKRFGWLISEKGNQFEIQRRN